nr:MAG TPA: hypothetical protein [Caudoviricetes sp.]
MLRDARRRQGRVLHCAAKAGPSSATQGDGVA